MKSLFFQAALIFAVITTATAQQTLTQSSYPTSVLGTDTLKKTTITSAFPTLSPATVGLWDMSVVTDTVPVYYAYRVATGAYQYADSNMYTFAGYGYQGNAQTSITAAGIMEYGVNIQKSGYSLTPLTLGVTDSLIINQQNIVYTSPRKKIAFPATYMSSWTSTYSADFSFQVSLSLISLDHAPGVVRSFITQKDSVIGWGKMRVKDLSGSPSAYLNVLQVQTTIIKTDSFYINGSLAPLPLLSIFNLAQGRTDSTFLHNYYRAQEVTPLAEVRFSNGAYTTPRKATTHVQRLFELGVADINNNARVNIYPNPATGDKIFVDGLSAAGQWEYSLADISGKAIAKSAITVNNGATTIPLQANIKAGNYYLTLIRNGVVYCVKPISIAE